MTSQNTVIQFSMFNTKQKPQAVAKAKTAAKSEVKNSFLAAATKKSFETKSGNGALKYTSTGSAFIDQFGVMGKFKEPRPFNDIVSDFQQLWAENPLNAVKFSLFLRTIPRKVNLPDGTSTEEPQKGAELKHESIMRMVWLAVNNPETFWKNILLFVSVGSWHDIFTMLQYDFVYNGWDNRKLDWAKFGDLISAALKNEKTSELVKKYLPQIKANSACKTIEAQANNAIAKWLCSLLFGSKNGNHANYKLYRKLKTSGTAHEWQKLISNKRFSELDFAKIHGRALSILVKGKFLKNQGLSDKYAAWVAKPETEVKYTGFVHELFQGLPRDIQSVDSNQKETINKQFKTLVEKVKGSETPQTSLIVVRDTSGSMGSQCTGTKSTCYDIGKALALYYSDFLTGAFQDHWIEFNSDARIWQWKGKTPIEKWYNDKSSFVGSTDFQSVIRLFARLKKEGAPEADFPQGILCISDSEFNPTALGKTNVQAALDTLRVSGFSEDYISKFVIVLWNLKSNFYGKGTGEKFETVGGVKNVFYFSGFSASIITFLTTGKVSTAGDVVEASLNQEILNMVEL